MEESNTPSAEDEAPVVSLFTEDVEEDKDEPAPAPQEPAAPDDDLVPEKYRGKTQEELVAMLSAAEEYQGRQSNDIGTLRSQVDQLIQAQLGQQAQPAPEPEDEPSFFEDPETAVGRQIENHPLVQEARATSAQYKAEMAQQRRRS